MEGSRVSEAVARIETAIARIEAAVGALPAQPAIDPALAERAEELENTIRTSVDELDRLIEGLGG